MTTFFSYAPEWKVCTYCGVKQPPALLADDRCKDVEICRKWLIERMTRRPALRKREPDNI